VRWRCWTFGAAIALSASRAITQPEAVRLDYAEGAKCGGEGAFVAQVTSRSPRVQFTSSSAPRSLVVRVEPHGARMVGRIELHEADGTTTERSVTGASCDDVISAVGLVAALALDPFASTRPTAVDAGAQRSGATEDAGAQRSGATEDAGAQRSGATEDAGAQRSGATEDAGAQRNVRDESENDDAQTLAPEKRRWSVGAGADAEAVFGVSPDALFAVPVFFEVTRALGEHAALGGAIRFERAGETSLDASGAGGDFTWTVGAADACFAWRAARFRLHACARSHAGAIEAHGEGVAPEKSATRPWVDVSAALAIRVRVAGPVFVEASGSVGVALVQDRFFLEPNQTVFQVQPLTAHAGGGLGFEIW